LNRGKAWGGRGRKKIGEGRKERAGRKGKRDQGFEHLRLPY